MANKRVFVDILGSSRGAVKAFEESALAADEASGKMGASFDKGGKKVEGVFSKLGNAMESAGIPFGSSVSKMGEKFGELETKGQKLNGVMSEVGKAVLLGAGAAFIAVAAEALHLADEFDVVEARLKTSISNTGAHFSAFKGKIDAAYSSGAKFGFDMTDVAGALATLTPAAGSPTKALADLQLAENLARQRGESLGEAAQQLTSIYGGNTRALKQMGVNLDIGSASAHALTTEHMTLTNAEVRLTYVQSEVASGHLKGAAGAYALLNAQRAVRDDSIKLRDSQNAIAEAFGALNKRTKGAAEAFGKTLPGQIAAANAALHNLGINFGETLTLAIKKAEIALAGAVTWFEKHKAVAEALGGVIAGVLAAAIAVYVVNTGVKMVKATSSAVSSVGSLISKLFAQKTAQVETGLSSEAMAATTAESNAAMARSQLVLGANTEGFSTKTSAWLESIGASSGTMAAEMETSGATSEMALTGIGAGEEELAVTSEAVGPEVAAGLGPIGIVIMAVGLAATLLASHWKAIWKDIRAVALDAWHFLDGDVIQPLKAGWDALWGGIKTVIGDAISFVKDHIDLIVGVLTGPLGLAIVYVATHWAQVWGGIKTVASDAWHFLYDNLFKPILDIIDKVIGGVEKVIGVFSKIGHVASKIAGGAHTVVNDLNPLHWAANGAIVNGPTIMGIGESGPEAIIPLDRLPGGIGTTNFSPLPGGALGGFGKGTSTSPVAINATYSLNLAADMNNPQALAKVQQMIEQSHGELADRLLQVIGK